MDGVVATAIIMAGAVATAVIMAGRIAGIVTDQSKRKAAREPPFSLIDQ